tara:strand:- start:831 stop:1016 length:186 start_codon:yes stop_codon:yes gene_type:complete
MTILVSICGLLMGYTIASIIMKHKGNQIQNEHTKDLIEIQRKHNAKMDTLVKEVDKMLEDE